MENYNTRVMEILTINSVVPDMESECFIVKITGYKPFTVFFIEIENFIGEFDYKLEKYLEKFETIEEKIEDAIDIGYDFEDMVSDYVKNLIEYGLIILSPESEL